MKDTVDSELCDQEKNQVLQQTHSLEAAATLCTTITVILLMVFFLHMKLTHPSEFMSIEFKCDLFFINFKLQTSKPSPSAQRGSLCKRCCVIIPGTVSFTEQLFVWWTPGGNINREDGSGGEAELLWGFFFSLYDLLLGLGLCLDWIH